MIRGNLAGWLRAGVLVSIALALLALLAGPARGAVQLQRAGTVYCADNSPFDPCIGAPSLGNGDPIIMTAAGRQISFSGGNLVFNGGQCLDVNQQSSGSDFVVGGCSGPGTVWLKSTNNGTIWTSQQLKNDGLTDDELCSDGVTNDPATTGHTGENNVYCRYNT